MERNEDGTLGPRHIAEDSGMELGFDPVEQGDAVAVYLAEIAQLREHLRRCGELARSRKTGAIQNLVKRVLGVEHFEKQR